MMAKTTAMPNVQCIAHWIASIDKIAVVNTAIMILPVFMIFSIFKFNISFFSC